MIITILVVIAVKFVIYFSRTGYTRKVAYEIANKIGADIYEIKTKEKISGDLGFGGLDALECINGLWKWKN